VQQVSTVAVSPDAKQPIPTETVGPLVGRWPTAAQALPEYRQQLPALEEIFLLFWFAGRTVEEIAQLVQRPQGEVESHLHAIEAALFLLEADVPHDHGEPSETHLAAHE
jgi:DNA-directed RNA polymerase specialized sigma24 family protein